MGKLKALTVGVVTAAALAGSAPAASADPRDMATTMLRQAIADLPVAAESRDGYERSKFRHWIDEDQDQCNTRAEVLLAEAVVPPTVAADAASPVVCGTPTTTMPTRRSPAPGVSGASRRDKVQLNWKIETDSWYENHWCSATVNSGHDQHTSAVKYVRYNDGSRREFRACWHRGRTTKCTRWMP